MIRSCVAVVVAICLVSSSAMGSEPDKADKAAPAPIWLMPGRLAPWLGILEPPEIWRDREQAIHDLDACVGSLERERADAERELRRLTTTHAGAIAALEASSASSRQLAEDYKASGREAATRADEAPGWSTVALVGGIALVVGVVAGGLVVAAGDL